MPQPTAEDFPKPATITGGCLCGSIRYRVDFPEDHDFLASSRSCQCTQCRRNTGALFLVSHTVPLSCLTYVTPVDSLKNFVATPGFQRGLCTNCGSFLYWRDESRDDVAIAVGCVDPGVLVGGKDGDGGERYGFGFALANMKGHNFWCENEIRGITDEIIGEKCGIKWATSSEDGVRM